MAQEPYRQIEHNGHLISIFHDDNPTCPREWDNLGTMYTNHRDYLPEKRFHDHFETDEVFKSRWQFREKFLREYIALTVYLYDHSGLTVSTTPFSCPWDSGLLGIIAVPVAKVREEYGWKLLTARRRQAIEQHLRNEVKEFDDYLTGQVYGYEIAQMNDDGKILGSCWGFYGDIGIEYMITDCKSQIDTL